jgi:hypothetical protein
MPFIGSFPFWREIYKEKTCRSTWYALNTQPNPVKSNLKQGCAARPAQQKAFPFTPHALDAILGVKSGYFVWRPYFVDMEGSGIEDVDEGTGFLYGPVVSLGLTDKLSFSFVGLYGKQSTYWDMNNTKMELGTTDAIATGTVWAEMTRLDLDSALNYDVFENLKIFVGYKYQYNEIHYQQTFLMTELDSGFDYDSVINQRAVFDCPAHGPALGVGLTKTLGSNFFAGANLSAIYMMSKFHFQHIDTSIYSATVIGQIDLSPFTIEAEDISYDTHQMGLNTEVSMGMSVDPIVVTLGASFQWMRIEFLEDYVIPGTTQTPSFGWMNDYLYGIFVSVLYML